MKKRANTKKSKIPVATPTNTQEEREINWKSWLDILSKASFFVLAITYITGFLVITITYSQIGLPLPVSPTKYLTAGFLPLATFAFLWVTLRITKNHWKAKGRFDLLLNGILAISLFNILYCYLVYSIGGYLSVARFGTPPQKPYLDIMGLISLGLLIVSGILFVIFGVLKKKYPKYLKIVTKAIMTFSLLFFSFFFVRHIAGSNSEGTELWLFLTVFVVVFLPRPKIKNPTEPLSLILTVIVWIGLYGLLVYRNIPRIFGGGQTNEVLIWSSYHPLYPHIELSSDSIEAELVDKTSNEYVLRIKDSLGQKHIIEIGKDKIQSIVYLNPSELKARQAKIDSLAKAKESQAKEEMGPPAPPPAQAPTPSTQGGGP